MNVFRKSLTALLLAAFLAGGLGILPAYAVAPSNDDFNTPRVIGSTPYAHTMDVADATVAADDPPMSDCGLNVGVRTVWYSFTPASNGEVVIDTFGSDYDTAVTIWTGTRGSLSPVVCNDDSTLTTYNGRTNFQGVNSYLTALLLAGTTYYIEIAQFSGYGGSAAGLPEKPEGLAAQTTGSNLNFNVTFTNMTALPLGKYDDRDARLRFGSGWVQQSASGWYLGTRTYSTTIGTSVSFFVTGQRFKVIYTSYPSYGRLNVYVDNRYYGQINQAGDYAFQQAWISPVLLSTGTHSVKLVTLSGSYFDLDAIEVSTPTDSIPPATISDLTAVGGTEVGSIRLNWTTPGDDGMTGKIVSPGRYHLRYSSSPITTQWEWDQATAVNTGLPVPKDPGVAETMTLSGLEPGQTYYFAVRAQDEENLALISNVASAMATTPPPLGAGTWDDNVSNWRYTGGWLFYSGGGPYASTLHYSGTVGSSALIFINGQKFNLIYTRATNRGVMDVYIDGIYIASINMNGTLAYQTVWSECPVLAPGLHSVRFVHASGAYVDIDGIVVKDAVDSTPPAAIVSLVATTGTSNGQVNLSWNAPGDDGFGGGPVTSYLVRYSTSPITNETTWNAATPVTTGLPAPVAPGELQTMTVSGLTPNQVYHFAVRARDEEPNTGGLSNPASAMAKGPDPLGPGTYDNTNAAWNYSSNWLTYGGGGPYNNTLHYTATAGTYATVPIYGQQFEVWFTKAANRGKIDVYVNNVLKGTIDAYDTATKWQQKWTSPVLEAPDTYVVKLVYSPANVAGTYIDIDAIKVIGAPDLVAPAKITDLVAASGASNGQVNLSWTATGDDGNVGTATSYVVCQAATEITDCNAAGVTKITTGLPAPAPAGTPQNTTISGLNPGQVYYFAIYAVDDGGNAGPVSNSPFAAAKAPPPVGAGMTDNTHPSWIWKGSWTSAGAAGPYNSTFHYSMTVGNETSIVFSGQKVTLYYVKSYNRGTLDVYIDGVKVDSINAYAASTLWQQTWSSGPLAAGTHTLRVVHASGQIIDIDAIKVFESVDAVKPCPITDLTVSAGASEGQVLLNWTAPGDDDASGTVTSYLVRYSSSPITDEAKWNAATPVTAGLPAPQPYGSPQSMTVSNLVPGDIYYFAVRGMDEAENLGDLGNSPTGPVKTAAPVASGVLYNDNHSAWRYLSGPNAWPPVGGSAGGWTMYTNASYEGGTVEIAANLGNSALITFNGTGFAFIYTKHSNRGSMDVYVDGVKVGTVNMNSATTAFKQRWEYTGLPAGNHVVKFVFVGPSGYYGEVDGIEVFP